MSIVNAELQSFAHSYCYVRGCLSLSNPRRKYLKLLSHETSKDVCSMFICLWCLCKFFFVRLSRWAAVTSPTGCCYWRRTAMESAILKAHWAYVGIVFQTVWKKKQQVAIPSVVFFADLHGFVQQCPPLATNCTIQVSTTSRVSWSPEGNSKSHGIGHCHHDNLYINNVVVYFSKVVKCQLRQVGYYMPKIPLCLSQGSRCIGGGSRHSKCRVCLLFPPVLFFFLFCCCCCCCGCGCCCGCCSCSCYCSCC